MILISFYSLVFGPGVICCGTDQFFSCFIAMCFDTDSFV